MYGLLTIENQKETTEESLENFQAELAAAIDECTSISTDEPTTQTPEPAPVPELACRCPSQSQSQSHRKYRASSYFVNFLGVGAKLVPYPKRTRSRDRVSLHRCARK